MDIIQGGIYPTPNDDELTKKKKKIIENKENLSPIQIYINIENMYQ